MGFEQEALDALISRVEDSKSAVMHQAIRSQQGEPVVLRQIARGVTAPSKIAAAAKVSSGRVSAALSSLEKKGYITRGVDPDDRRNVRVAITEAGREQNRRNHEEMKDSICWIFSQMGERRTREFVDLVTEFVTYMSLCKPGEGRPTPEQIKEAFRGKDE